MSTENLPPYGFMEASIERAIATRPLPEAWVALSGAAAAGQYKAWKDTLITDLNQMLWPSYDTVLKKWKSTPSAALIDADFELFAQLQPKMKEHIKGLVPEAGTHEEFFLEEDDEDIIFGHKYERYDPSLPKHLRDSLTDVLWTGCDRKMGSLHFQVKAELQRPRAFQVALIQQRNFHHHWANSAGSPAMISGHCLQGMTGGCSAFLLFGRHLDAVSLGALAQLTVDIGDRRVFAGVHYPSDNVSSWLAAFRLLPHVLEQGSVAAASRFLWDALTQRSDVYAALRTHMTDNAGSPYRLAMNAIEAAATATGIDTSEAIPARLFTSPDNGVARSSANR
jgi:hypothetical protein